MELSPILAMDIGGGTQDILLFDPQAPIENAIKLVLPSPTVIAGLRIQRATRAGRPVFLSGRLMGGGSITKAVRQHLAAGLPVYSLKDPALSFHDDLEKVKSWGMEIVAERPDDQVVEVRLGDLDLAALDQALRLFEVTRPTIVALALQDHGYSPQASNRLTRFAHWQRFLSAGGFLDDLLFSRPPSGLTRWLAAAEEAPGAYFMDTSGAALRGALLDEVAAQALPEGLVMVNTGNEHTVAFLARDRRIWGVYEHHTGLLDPEILADQLDRFAQGTLSHKEVFDQWGHGVAYQPGYQRIAPFRPVIITGPRREIAKGLGHLAAPYGEMMLSGCFGLIAAVREHLSPESGV